MTLRIALATALFSAISATAVGAAARPSPTLGSGPTGMPVHLFSGTLQATRHLMLTLRLRTGQRLIVDAAPAAAASNAPHAFVIGEALTAQGSLIAGVLVATSVTVTTPAARDWVPDR